MRQGTPLAVAAATAFLLPPLAEADVVQYTIVIHHQDVDTFDPLSNQTETRLGTFINGTYPGPLLEANLGDEIVLTVINEMVSSSTSIHVHGQHQEGTFFYDGVPDVTQCPIRPGSSFTYTFTASPAGTFSYHSHVPFQTGDGIFGPFIVRDPENDPYEGVVADEVVIGLSDWLRYYSDQVYQYTSQFRFDSWPLAHYVSFVNGRGQGGFDPFVFTVASDETYRLRIYAVGVEYNYRVHLAGHTMTVIAADGSLVKPIDVNFLDVYSGERYDVLVEANQPVGTYELRARVIDWKGRLTDTFTSAMLQYDGAAADGSIFTADEVMRNNDDIQEALLDPFSLAAFKDENGNYAAGYKALEGPRGLLPNPWTYHTTSYAVENERQFAFMDGWDFYFARKASSPLVLETTNEALKRLVEEESRTLSVSSYSNASAIMAATIGPRIEFLETNQVIDIVFQNAPTPGNELGSFTGAHPMHVHGHYFWVLGSGVGAFNKSIANSSSNFIDPPQRDNIVVKPQSWVLVRLKATNAGIWLFHCHSEAHLVFGMSTTLVVGRSEERPNLPDNFPVCGATRNPASKETSGATQRGFELPAVLLLVFITCILELMPWKH